MKTRILKALIIITVPIWLIPSGIYWVITGKDLFMKLMDFGTN